MTLNRQIRAALGTLVDSVGTKANGNVVVRRTFFYRHGVDAEMVKDSLVARIKKAGLELNVVDFGEHWAAFNGGARTSRDSHWWVEFSAKRVG
jgi:hypothetical protein